MTKREIIKSLIVDKQVPERMGLHEHFWPHIIENTWGAQGLAPDTDFTARFGLDLRSMTWFGAPPPRPDLERVEEETDLWITRRDGWGAITKYWKKKAGTPEHIGFTVTTPEIWQRDFREQLLALDVRKSDAELERFRQEYARLKAGDEFFTFASLFVFEDLRRILGDVVMLESLLLEPEWIHDFNDVVTRKNIEWFDWLFREVGLPDGIHVYEDLAYTYAPFASPECHRELVLPYHKRLFGFWKDHGLPIICHTCGDFRAHIPSLIEAGVDCIQALEAKTGMNVVTLAEQYRDRLCFMGNIDVRALESGDRDRIREECLGKLNGMKKLRAPYIYMSDHSISTGVKLADYEYMVQLFRENCWM